MHKLVGTEWKKLLDCQDNEILQNLLINGVCLYHAQQESIVFSSEAAAGILHQETNQEVVLPLKEFTSMMSRESGEVLLELFESMKTEKESRVVKNIVIVINNTVRGKFVYFRKLDDQKILLFYIDHQKHSNLDKEYKKIIHELEKAQRINNLILEGASDYIYQLDLVKNICTFSPHALDVLPLKTATFDNALETCLSFIIPEDRHIFLDSFTPFLTGKSDYHKAEYRVYTKSNEIMWIKCNGKGTHDENGNPILIAGSLVDTTLQKKAQDELHRMLYFDQLTKIKNRYGFEKDLSERMEEENASGCVIYLDIKNFKMYNDVFGHSFGNDVLIEVSKMFQLLLTDNCGIYRIGGDEFAAHFQISDKSEIERRLVPLILRLKQPKLVNDHNIFLSISMGACFYPAQAKNAEELLTNSEIAMYAGLKEKKEGVNYYLNGSSQTLSRRYLLENQLRISINNDFHGFRLVFQPIVDTKTGVWKGAEALLRFTSPTLPDVPITEVIDILEATYMILPVGKWVVKKAIEECVRWRKNGFGDLFVHVNCSAIQINDVDFIRSVKEFLKQSELKKGSLICELTETSLINNFDNAMLFCHELEKLGIEVSLDDFGSGYSSLSYLKRLPIKQIKMDREFAQNFLKDDYNQAIISVVNELAKSIGLSVCVEGVEEKEVYEKLKEMQIPFIQGFYFAKPLEAEQFYSMLEMKE